MYQSPIEIITKQIRTQFEDNVFKAIQDYGIVVDKEELIKALQYDRGQYEKGYADGMLAQKSEWISVEERLPTPFVGVLVYMPDETPHPTVREGFVNKRGEWYAGGFDRLPDEVVSWREMPEPPKMKGGAE